MERLLFAPKRIATAQAALQKKGRAQCDRVSLYHYNAEFSKDEDGIQDSETIQNISELDSSVTAGNILIGINLLCNMGDQSLARSFDLHNSFQAFAVRKLR